MRTFILIASCCLLLNSPIAAQYNEDYVGLSIEKLGNYKDSCSIVEMTRMDQRVKVKYFADKDASGKSVYQRYQTWSKNKSIIAVSSGTYFMKENVDKPVGICIDEGVIINKNKTDDMDGLAIVYKTGGIVVSDLKEGNLTVQDGGNTLTLNLRDDLQRQKFYAWSTQNSATVFQTHLLYYKNKLRVGVNGSPALRERRFLAVGKDESNTVRYYIVNIVDQNTLYNATIKAVDYLKDFVNELTFVINLDTGAQDYYEVRKPNGQVIKSAKGEKSFFEGKLPISVSKNLVAFYFE